MPWRSEIGSWILITIVTGLIWIWASGETREEKSIMTKATFTVLLDDDKTWIIEPKIHAFSMVVEGSRLSIQNVEALAKNGFYFQLQPSMDNPQVDIEEAVRSNQDFQSTGAILVSVDKPSVSPKIDELIGLQVHVEPNLPGVQTVEARPSIDPPVVTIYLPKRLQKQFSDLRIEAFVSQERSSLLPEGVMQNLDVKLRILPETVASNDHVQLSQPSVRMSFTILSQTRELLLDFPVNIQLQGPWQDQKDFDVDIVTDSIRDVTIIADADLIRRIESGEANVVAVIQLKSIEKERFANEQDVVSKPISFFLAMIGDEVFHQVEARVGSSDEMPMIRLKVTHLPKSTPE